MRKVESINRFKQTIKNIIDDGNMVTFEFYNEDNDGIIINESESLKDDKGNHHSFEWFNSCTAHITIKEATQALYDLGIMNPYIEDIELEEVTQ